MYDATRIDRSWWGAGGLLYSARSNSSYKFFWSHETLLRNQSPFGEKCTTMFLLVMQAYIWTAVHPARWCIISKLPEIIHICGWSLKLLRTHTSIVMTLPNVHNVHNVHNLHTDSQIDISSSARDTQTSKSWAGWHHCTYRSHNCTYRSHNCTYRSHHCKSNSNGWKTLLVFSWV